MSHAYKFTVMAVLIAAHHNASHVIITTFWTIIRNVFHAFKFMVKVVLTATHQHA